MKIYKSSVSWHTELHIGFVNFDVKECKSTYVSESSRISKEKEVDKINDGMFYNSKQVYYTDETKREYWESELLKQARSIIDDEIKRFSSIWAQIVSIQDKKTK